MGLNLVIRRRLAEAAIGVRSERSVAEDPIGGGRRFLFLVPQEETTLVGTWYGMVEDRGLDVTLEQGRRDLLADVDRACPGLGLTAADVVGQQWAGSRSITMPMGARPGWRIGRGWPDPRRLDWRTSTRPRRSSR